MRIPGIFVYATAVVMVGLSAGPALEAETRGKYSDRTLLLGIQVDRYEGRLLSYTAKDRPFVRSLEQPAPRAYRVDETLQLEVTLQGPGGRTHSLRFDAGPLCLEHEPSMDPHVEGDRFVPHRDGFLVEVPEIPGFDRVEVAYYENDRGSLRRKPLGLETLDASRYHRAAGPFEYDDLIVGSSAPATGQDTNSRLASTVIWPEDVSDPDIYLIHGNPADGSRRLNIVIVPDGYTYAEKAAMEQHAADMVAYLRQTSPYDEHDTLINYTLVYAYSQASGTDQCDCGIVVDTAMGTRFPTGATNCGNSANRCLSYGGGCDADGIANIVAAEQRAPFHDETIIMVNTTRYGGCANSRSTYSAGHSSGEDVAAHELGHSIAGLADEYVSNSGCGSFAGGINTSFDGVDGAWPEWIGDIGAPDEGAQYWSQCVYRPENNCIMRSLFQPFCAVCRQHWSLTIFGSPRVSPFAPIESQSAAPTQVVLNDDVTFSVTTRLAQGANVTNQRTWTVDDPTNPPAVTATGTDAYNHTFNQLGFYTVEFELVADTNFIKPSKNAANVDTVQWIVEVVSSVCQVGCADGLPQCDVDGDGLGDICDPCPNQALNDCYGPVALDNTALIDLRVNTDGDTSASCSGNKTDCRGKTWVADFGQPASASGYNQEADGVVCDLTAGCPIDPTVVFGCSDATTEDLFRCGHSGTDLIYDFDVPDGEYLVNLLTTNIQAATDGVGDRVFSVALNGVTPVQMTGIDPVDLAGVCNPAAAACTPATRSAIVTVAGAAGLQIEFLGNVEQPMVQGIEVLCLETIWYADADGDGFGDPNSTMLACYQPTGYLADSSDCNDADPLDLPGGVERCDTLDNDCDGLFDEDVDGDGFDVCNDCTELLNWMWSTPGEVTGLTILGSSLNWVQPLDPGGSLSVYQVLRTTDTSDFTTAQCIALDHFIVTAYIDTTLPQAGEVFHYLVRATSYCEYGSLGTDSNSAERAGPICGGNVNPL